LSCSQFLFKYTKSQIPILVFWDFLWKKVIVFGGLGAERWDFFRKQSPTLRYNLLELNPSPKRISTAIGAKEGQGAFFDAFSMDVDIIIMK